MYHLKMKQKKEEEIDDLVFYNNLKIVQNKNYFKFSLDSLLLSNFAKINLNTKKIMDLCTGNAPIPLILSQKTKSKIIGIEIQKEIYDLAIKSVEINNLHEQITLINDDAKNITNYFETDTFDLILCNPPYFKYQENSIINKNEKKSLARHEISLKLNDIFKISKKLLKNGGLLCIIHRTDRLIEIIDLMKQNNIEPKRIRFVYPKNGSESNLVLVEGSKNGKTGLKILSPFYVHSSNGEYTSEVLKMFGK